MESATEEVAAASTDEREAMETDGELNGLGRDDEAKPADEEKVPADEDVDEDEEEAEPEKPKRVVTRKRKRRSARAKPAKKKPAKPAGEKKVEEEPSDEEPPEEEPSQEDEKPPVEVDEGTAQVNTDSDQPVETNSEEQEQPAKDQPKEEIKPILEHDTEMVSEDELPNENSKAPLETEAVSDEELPNTAIDTLETEAVSEDELPSEGKKKKDGEDENDEDKKSNEASAESQQSKQVESPTSNRRKLLPDFEKFWKTVSADVTDFNGWTYLLQYVDQGNDVEAARKSYDEFFKHYPYCYGYWRKYADYEKKKGDKTKCEEIYERGLKAIPLSVDLWLHYLNYVKTTYKGDEDHIRGIYDRAISTCGLEFKSDRLWDSYIKWETENKNISNVSKIYDKLLTIPLQGYSTHFSNYEEFVKSSPPNKIIPVDEFISIRTEVLEKLKRKPQPPVEAASAAPPGDADDDDDELSKVCPDEEATLIREKIIDSRKKKFNKTVSEITARWTYEEGIRRPYFHVKPLEKSQLANWKNYLAYETQQGNKERTIILFERCLIACALYEEFWIKYIHYLESESPNGENNDLIRHTYERACLIHHPKKAVLSLNWASFEESVGNPSKARDIIIRLENAVPHLLTVSLRRINLERRCGNMDEVVKLFDHYIANAKSDSVYMSLTVKYCRFASKILKDNEKATKILRQAIEEDKDNIRLYFLLIDLLPSDSEECVTLFDQMLSRDSIDIEQKVIISQRKVEFLDDFGSSPKRLSKAQSEYAKYLKQWKEKKRSAVKTEIKDEKKPKGENPSSPSSNQNSYQGNYSQVSSYNQSMYGQSDPNYTNYQNWGYSQTNYGNYNQSWTGYNYYS